MFVNYQFFKDSVTSLADLLLLMDLVQNNSDIILFYAIIHDFCAVTFFYTLWFSFVAFLLPALFYCSVLIF